MSDTQLRADRQASRTQHAKVALARRLLTLCYYGLRDGKIRCLQAPGPARTRPVKAAP